MEEIIKSVVNAVEVFVLNSNFFISLLIGCSIIILESIIPMLPLSVFIAINTIAFGNFLGFIISLISTIIGCSLSYFISKMIRKKIYLRIKKIDKYLAFIENIDRISFSKLVLILAMPFTPAFSINIAAGLADMEYKKYLLALIISKIFIVYFWGFIATTFLESITDIGVIIKIIVIILIAFILSKIVMKKFDL